MELLGYIFIFTFFGGIIGFLAYDSIVNFYYGEDEEELFEMPVENNRNDNQPVFFNVG